MNVFKNIHKLVQKIPKGKVTTYGEIARVSGTSPKVVGYALHANKDPDNTPCHRVVTVKGRLATGYAFGGSSIQKNLLTSEGVTFEDDMHVHIKKHFYQFSSPNINKFK